MRTYQQSFILFIDGLYKAQNMSFLLERNLRKCTIVQTVLGVKFVGLVLTSQGI